MNIYILKLESSNWPSVEQALIRADYNPISIEVSQVFLIDKKSILIIPGVGNIGSLSKEIEKGFGINNLKDFISNNDIRIIGICLGFQFLCKASEENLSAICLNLLDYSVESIFQPRMPSVGWNIIERIDKNNAYNFPDEILNLNYFYFTHSYAVKANSNEKKNETIYVYEVIEDKKVAAAIINNKVVGYQFHPEKSGSVGIELISGTIKYLVSLP